MGGYYTSGSYRFNLFTSDTTPSWRPPQRGSLGALLAHWSLPHQTNALVAIPTGAGKTAIATAAPYLLKPNRTLVVVPSRDLRKQLAASFATEDVLQRVGALSRTTGPTVVDVTGQVDSWDSLLHADVVVGLPNSVSPAHYPDNLPAVDLFDLVVVDEAHHGPAPTWRAILSHFSSAKGLLLTATPQRRDRQRLPGDMVYYYPLRQALDEGFYKPIHAELVDLPTPATKSAIDESIATRVAHIAQQPEHNNSSVLIRASSIDRATHLAQVYSSRGLPIKVLHSRMSATTRDAVVADLRRGNLRGVAVVDMLAEGFDLPSLRIAAYHDKHKSLNATIQSLGRLVRVDPQYPQDSVVVTCRDMDVYPQLQGVVRALWEEDADWIDVLPGIIDDLVESTRANIRFAQRLTAAPPEISIEAIQPVMRAVVYEVHNAWEPSFVSGDVPEPLREGQRIRGQEIVYAALTPGNRTIIVLTRIVGRPRWHPAPGLDSPTYDLHLLTWCPATQSDMPHLLIANSEDGAITRELLIHIGASGQFTNADPARMQDAFDSLDRISVSNVGLRNTYLGTRGVPSYRTFAGSGVDAGLRNADTARGALGHAMAQIEDGSRTYTAGISTAKGKYWESRYVPLREYDDSLADYADRYWYPPAAGPGRLLPGVTRGERLSAFPDEVIAAIELDPSLYGKEWTLAGETSIETLDLQLDASRTRSPSSLPLVAFDPARPEEPVWRGEQDRTGSFRDLASAIVYRGFGTTVTLSELLTARPPNIYFLDGQTVCGGLIYRTGHSAVDLPPLGFESSRWSGVDVEAETRAKARSRRIGVSIHEALEAWLSERPRHCRHRWILCNDGPGEIADYIVLEIGKGLQVKLGLWHAKASAGRLPSVRLNDMQVVVAQAIKSRRWVTDRSLWAELGARLSGRSHPRLTVIEGSDRLLRVLCGLNTSHVACSLTKRGGVVDCEIGVAQPGLSLGMLREELDKEHSSIAARQIRELLTVWHDAVAPISGAVLLASD